MAKRQPTINFATQDFRAKHGFQPRGVALWTFYFNNESTSWRGSSEPVTYTEAKRLAVIEARKRGVTAVRVDPDPAQLTLYTP